VARHDQLRVGDNAAGDGLGQRPGATHGQDHIAHLHGVGIAPLGHGQRLGGILAFIEFKLEHTDIRHRVGAHARGLDFLAIDQVHDDARGIARDMVIGDDIAVLGNNRPAAGPLHALHAPAAGLLHHDIDADQRRIGALHGWFNFHVAGNGGATRHGHRSGGQQQAQRASKQKGAAGGATGNVHNELL